MRLLICQWNSRQSRNSAVKLRRIALKGTGMNHLGLATHDIDRTIEFYQGVLGLEPVAYYLRELGEGYMRQVFFDLGNGQTLEFAQPHNVEGIADGFDAGINEGLGCGKLFGVGLIHFAFNVESMDELEERRRRLEAAGCEILGPIDLDWLHSFYFTDPNGIQLEFAYTVKETPGEAYLEAQNSDLWKSLAN